MKRNLLFIILCVATLTFAGCGKTETPVMSNNVKTESSTEVETTIENEEITEEVEAPTENIVEENITEEVKNAEPTETELPADVDLEKEYEEPIKETVEPDYESMTQDERIEAATKELVDDIISQYIQEQAQQNHIPVDDSDWGRVSDGTLANPTDWENRERNPDLAGDLDF